MLTADTAIAAILTPAVVEALDELDLILKLFHEDAEATDVKACLLRASDALAVPDLRALLDHARQLQTSSMACAALPSS